MMRRALAAIAGLCLLGLAAAPAAAKTNAEEPRELHIDGQSLLGKFDQEQLQRGFKVYSEVCSSCHSMDLLYYRNLAQKDGPFYSAKYPNPNESPDAQANAATCAPASLM